MPFQISVDNWAGPMVATEVKTEDEIKPAVIELIEGMAQVIAGDTLVIKRVEG